jgi:hypothetical protein
MITGIHGLRFAAIAGAAADGIAEDGTAEEEDEVSGRV